MSNVFGIMPQRNTTVHGFFPLSTHPTGIVEQIPFSVIEGKESGPTLSISANIHGDEFTGTLVLHELLRDKEILENLRGRLILLHTLNPFGGAIGTRNYSLTKNDANRSFPLQAELDSHDGTFAQQNMRKLFLELKKHSNFHIDLHCSKTHSIPFVYVRGLIDDYEESKLIYEKSVQAARCFSLPLVFNSQDPKNPLKYHSTCTGSLVYTAKIPAFTVELGSKGAVDPHAIVLGVKGVKRTLQFLGMLENNQQEDATQERSLGPFDLAISKSPESGVLSFLVKEGEVISKGQKIATLRTIHGRNIGDGFVYSEHNGLILAQFEGAFFRRGESLLKIAVK